MAKNTTRYQECIYCSEFFSTEEKCKAHPCYAVKEENAEAKSKWSTDMIKLLISLYQEHEEKFTLVNFSPKQFLYVISEIMKLQGYQSITGDMCYNKWMGLKRLYMDEKMREREELIYAKKTEFNSTFQFFDEMDSVLKNKPGIVGMPGISGDLRKMSCTEVKKIPKVAAHEESNNSSDTEDKRVYPNLPYRLQKYLIKMHKAERKKERQYEKKQVLRRESLDILKKIQKNKENFPHVSEDANVISQRSVNAPSPLSGTNEELNKSVSLPNEEIHPEFEYLDNIPVDEVGAEFEHLEDIPGDEIRAELQNNLPGDEMDVELNFYNQVQIQKMEEIRNKGRRDKEHHKVIRECSDLFEDIHNYNIS